MTLTVVVFIFGVFQVIVNVMLWTAVEALTAELHHQEEFITRFYNNYKGHMHRPKEVELPGESFDWGHK